METLAKKLVDKMTTSKVIDPKKQDYYVYGTILLLTSFFITVLMLIAGLVLGCIESVAAYCAAYWVLHTVGDTYHCKKYYRCFFLTLSIFGFLMLINKLLSSENLIILSGILLTVYAAILTSAYLIPKFKVSRTMFKKPLVLRLIMLGIALGIILTHYAPLAFPFCYGMVAISFMQRIGGSI